jgi:hypothetical protein
MASTIAAGTTSGTAIAIAGDTSGVLQLQTNGTTAAVTIDTSQNVGIGVTSPTARLHVYGGSNNQFLVESSGAEANISMTGTSYGQINNNTGDFYITNGASANMFFRTASTERMRINSTGVVGIGQNPNAFGQFVVKFDATTLPNNSLGIGIVPAANTTNANFLQFYNATGNSCGNVTRNGTSNAVLYNTSSDYRLKENINPMTGALAKVQLLKPVTWTWKDTDDQKGEGFIAHEVQEVVPSAVSGDKDAIDANGKPNYQGMDASYLVATLTAAIQELNAKVEAQAVRIAELEGAK